MTTKSTGSRTASKAANGRPEKPYPDFPLFPHATGRWAKKIQSKTYYFGKWSDPMGALDAYLEVKDDLHAGRVPQLDKDALTVRDLCNKFMTSKRIKLDAGNLSPRTLVDYDRVCRRLVDEFGNRAVTSFGPSDFETLYGKLARKFNLNTQASEITMTRSVFKYAFDSDLIDRPIKYGQLFKVPNKADRRKAKARSRQTNGKKMFEAAEIRKMIDEASIQLKAMFLLAVNGGLGNTDCANLPMSAIDLDGGWIDYARQKSGIERRIPLWPETVTALREVMDKRKESAEPADADVLFVTKYGQRWVRFELEESKKFGKLRMRPKQDDAIAKQTAKLLRELGIKRPGIGFYSLRHVCETIGGDSKDQVAVDAIMGHVDPSMGAEYREHIEDERLRSVVNHIRQWLFGGVDLFSECVDNGK